MFAKRRANVLICSFVLSINFVRRARKVLFNPALRKHFSVSSKPKKTSETLIYVNELHFLTQNIIISTFLFLYLQPNYKIDSKNDNQL
jgi:hypothetical protein